MHRLLCLVFCIAPMVVNATTVGVVDYIIDGDTFGARILQAPDIEISVRVRIRNIDTPEIHGNCAYEIQRADMARVRLGQLIPVGTRVTLDNIKDDKYLGRIDANVYDLRGVDVGEILMSEELARPYSGGRRGSWCK